MACPLTSQNRTPYATRASTDYFERDTDQRDADQRDAGKLEAAAAVEATGTHAALPPSTPEKEGHKEGHKEGPSSLRSPITTTTSEYIRAEASSPVCRKRPCIRVRGRGLLTC